MPVRRRWIVFFNSNIEFTAKSVDADDINMLIWKACLPKRNPSLALQKKMTTEQKNLTTCKILEIVCANLDWMFFKKNNFNVWEAPFCISYFT